MDLRTLTAMGQTLQLRVRRFFDTPLAADATPLEIGQAVLDDVEQHVQPLGGGRRVFPYRALHVCVRTDATRQAGVEGVFVNFAIRVRERLSELRCQPPAALEVHVRCVVDAPSDWPADKVLHVEYVAAAGEHHRAAEAEATCPTVCVTVLAGATAGQEFSFTGPSVSIGRSSDPTDDVGRVRRNRLAFDDVVDGVNETVGRAHARLRYDADAGAYRLFDEGSRNGTAVVRDGEVIAVHPRDPRGVRVRSGDEVRVGRALLRITIGTR